MREETVDKAISDKSTTTKRFKRQITINLDLDTIKYFKEKAEKSGIPYQTLINLYLSDCVENNRELHLAWE